MVEVLDEAGRGGVGGLVPGAVARDDEEDEERDERGDDEEEDRPEEATKDEATHRRSGGARAYLKV